MRRFSLTVWLMSHGSLPARASTIHGQIARIYAKELFFESREQGRVFKFFISLFVMLSETKHLCCSPTSRLQRCFAFAQHDGAKGLKTLPSSVPEFRQQRPRGKAGVHAFFDYCANGGIGTSKE